MNPLTLLKFLPYIGIAVALAFGGWEYTTVKERDATIAQKDTALSAMKTQQAENIAAAVSKVAAEKAEDAKASAKIIDTLHASQADTEEKLNAASIALAQVPPVVTPPGCPDPVSRPDFTTFERGLPRDE